MKYIFFILLVIFSLFVFYSLPTVFHLSHLIFGFNSNHSKDEFLFYQDINKIDKEIEGIYHFQCSHPDFYEIGLGAKKPILKSGIYGYQPSVKVQIDVYSGNKKIASNVSIIKYASGSYFSNNINYRESFALIEVPIYWCSNNLKFKITRISGSFHTQDVNTDDLFYLYVSTSRMP